MRKYCQGIVVILCFAVLGYGKDEFKDFTSKEGRFSVQLPGAPKQETRTEAGIKLHNFTIDQRNGALVVSYADLPGAEFDYEAGLKGIMARMPESKLLKKGTWKLGDAEGLKYELEVTKPSKGFATGGLIVVNGRLYQVMALGSTYKADDPDVKKFVNSFKIAK